jgi:NDP-4-keto-2,6-dideoxyhexose 3-C-methyltransferase
MSNPAPQVVHAIDRCRICGNTSLEQVLDLGEQMLTGVFPRDVGADVTRGPLRLVKCVDGGDSCGLVQLAHSYDLGEMYGDNYGYRSGLNPSMVRHLQAKVARIRTLVDLRAGDLVVDIGSNDGTTLAAYPPELMRVGIDPTASKFASFYPAGSRLVADFFTADVLGAQGLAQRARVITSFSMFYDLEDPLQFMSDVHASLTDDGVWVFEQSYLPAMLEMNSYDTVCHEHLEYYALRQVKWMADRVGFTLVDVEFNDVNGGSFSVTASRAAGAVESPQVNAVLAQETAAGLDGTGPLLAFAQRVAESRREVLEFVDRARAEGRRIAALGASTKGNVLLQYCGLGPDRIEAVGEVNPEKYGTYTPGTWIPVVPETDLVASGPDYLLVLPWHFRTFFVGNAHLDGTTLVFPLPKLQVVDRGGH